MAAAFAGAGTRTGPVSSQVEQGEHAAPPLTASSSSLISSRSVFMIFLHPSLASDHRWCGYQLQEAVSATVKQFTGDIQIRHFVMAITGGAGYQPAQDQRMIGRRLSQAEAKKLLARFSRH
jgi:hypothetical protein